MVPWTNNITLHILVPHFRCVLHVGIRMGRMMFGSSLFVWFDYSVCLDCLFCLRSRKSLAVTESCPRYPKFTALGNFDVLNPDHDYSEELSWVMCE